MDEKAAEVLKHIADKLDVPVAHLWQGLVIYAPFKFYQWAIACSLLAVVSVVAFALYGYFRRTDVRVSDYRTENEDARITTFIVGAASVVLTAVVVACGFPRAMVALMSPEAWAAIHVLELVRGR